MTPGIAAPSQIHTLLGIENLSFGELAIRADTENTGRIWVGHSSALSATQNQVGFVDAGESLDLSLLTRMRLESVWLLATDAEDVAYVMGVSY